MQFIFLDESGYAPNWINSIAEQPYYVLSAVCIPGNRLAESYTGLREEMKKIELPGNSKPLGQGFEIKAKDVATGAGWWGKHNKRRNDVRNLMLSFPTKYGGTAFVVIIDKDAHYKKYYSPDDPYIISLRFILERVEYYLMDSNDYGYCIYDNNKRMEPEIDGHAASLIRDGSTISYISPYAFQWVTVNVTLDHILEMSFGNSLHSIGLQVADYFASFTYSYYKGRKPSKCGWWKTLETSLHKKDGRLIGVGLKEFP
jgi:hypothetical protein